MRKSRQILLVVSMILAQPLSAYAQASIAGVVKDASGAVLPGVTVEATSPVLIEKARTAVTDDSDRSGSHAFTPNISGDDGRRRRRAADRACAIKVAPFNRAAVAARLQELGSRLLSSPDEPDGLRFADNNGIVVELKVV